MRLLSIAALSVSLFCTHASVAADSVQILTYRSEPALVANQGLPAGNYFELMLLEPTSYPAGPHSVAGSWKLVGKDGFILYSQGFLNMQFDPRNGSLHAQVEDAGNNVRHYLDCSAIPYAPGSSGWDCKFLNNIKGLLHQVRFVQVIGSP